MVLFVPVEKLGPSSHPLQIVPLSLTRIRCSWSSDHVIPTPVTCSVRSPELWITTDTVSPWMSTPLVSHSQTCGGGVFVGGGDVLVGGTAVFVGVTGVTVRVGDGGGEVNVGPAEVGDGGGEVSVGPGEVADGGGEVSVGPGEVADGGGEVSVGPGEVGDGGGEVSVGSDDVAVGA